MPVLEHGRHPWLAQLALELRRTGLPVAYMRRVVAEARCHLADAAESGEPVADPGARLGDPVCLAALHLSAYRRRCWFLRHPLFGSLAVSVAAFIAYAAVELVILIAVRATVPHDAYLRLQSAGPLAVALAAACSLAAWLPSVTSHRRWLALCAGVLLVLSFTSQLSVTPSGEPAQVTLLLARQLRR